MRDLGSTGSFVTGRKYFGAQKIVWEVIEERGDFRVVQFFDESRDVFGYMLLTFDFMDSDILLEYDEGWYVCHRSLVDRIGAGINYETV